MPAPEELLLELWWEEGTRGHTSQLAVPRCTGPGAAHPTLGNSWQGMRTIQRSVTGSMTKAWGLGGGGYEGVAVEHSTRCSWDSQWPWRAPEGGTSWVG